MFRWAWRLFRREWRQQLLVLSLITVAVAATIVGAGVSTNTPPSPHAAFGTAHDLAVFPGPDPKLASQIAELRQRFGRVDVIENQTAVIPGSIQTYDLRAQDPHGPYGQPMLSLVSGHYPAGPGQVAVTSGVAADFRLKVGDIWHQGGQARLVTGIVQNPRDLLDEFALVAPGQVRSPTQVSVLFDATGVIPPSIGRNVSTPASVQQSNPLNPETIVLTAATLGMLLIGLVSVGGFTVVAQRRLRSLGMLGSLGATDRHVRLVMRANGLVVGVAGALAGAVLGLAAWLAYRPRLETSAHHVIGAFALPWVVIGPAMALAVVATFFAASRPARAMARVPVVAALSGRPAPPKRTRRWTIPAGLVFLFVGLVLLGDSAARGGQGGGQFFLVLGFVALMVALILLAPLTLLIVARIARWGPVSVRLALRDLARYRARSGSALGAISLGVLIAVVICVAATARYSNVLDYAGPNVTSNQLIVYTPNGPYGPGGPGNGNPAGPSAPSMRSMAAHAHSIASALGSHDIVQLDSTSATLQHAASGRNFSGPLYVATPQLLAGFGIKNSEFSPSADILTMRPGFAGLTQMQVVYGKYFGGNGPPGGGRGVAAFPCPPGECLANPVIQEISSLPAGTSAPNTVITEHAVRQLGLRASVSGWLIQTPQPLTSAQIYNARQTAAAAGLSIETRSSVPGLGEIINWATAVGIVLALGILAMSVGLIRAETASDLRTLTATGASGPTRRNLTAATAGALGLLGAVTGTVAGYLASAAWFRDSSLNGGLSALTSVPVRNLLIILVGMPLAAAVVGWLLAGREPPAIARRPME
ncbi:MAG TPA: FtsX-like permease family protein [Streptosporangiaceae bacterium]